MIRSSYLPFAATPRGVDQRCRKNRAAFDGEHEKERKAQELQCFVKHREKERADQHH